MTIVQGFMAFCALISTLCAVYVCWRSGRWRDDDQLQEMIARAAATWAESETAKALHHRVDQAESRLDICETRVGSMPTREDLSEVRGEVRALVRALELMERGVGRIEGIMMDKRL